MSSLFLEVGKESNGLLTGSGRRRLLCVDPFQSRTRWRQSGLKLSWVLVKGGACQRRDSDNREGCDWGSFAFF